MEKTKDERKKIKVLKVKRAKKSKRTTPGIRTWSPTVLLARPDSA